MWKWLNSLLSKPKEPDALDRLCSYVRGMPRTPKRIFIHPQDFDPVLACLERRQYIVISTDDGSGIVVEGFDLIPRPDIAPGVYRPMFT